MTVDLRHGNCLDILPTLPDCSVDSIVTDPPYELGFMGKKWDNSGIAYNVNLWQECLRVLKPGGHLLAFGGTRTYHRMACAIEDAGFEIRDSIHWLYGSGFPKSLDVSKAIDKVNGEPNRLFEFTAWMRTTGLTARQLDEITETKMGNHYTTHPTQPAIPTAAMWEVIRPHCADVPEWVDELVARIEAKREIIGKREVPVGHSFAGPTYGGDSSNTEVNITAPATNAARQWAGWGTALKPAHEPIVVARKPLIGTVASNVLEFGTGAINIDASRIGTTDKIPTTSNQNIRGAAYKGENADRERDTVYEQNQAGRWPANVILDDAIVNRHDDWPRYFYCAKPSRRERNAGLHHLPEQQGGVKNDSGRGFSESDPHREVRYQNHHPTVKPLALMRYLVRLVTPPNGTVLEPFAGSGTTLMACVLENFHAIGIEMTDEYLPIIQGRIAWAEEEASKESPQQELEL